MASKVRDRSKPVVYLDTSTLCDAFKAHVGSGSEKLAAYRPLLPWIAGVAKKANLCVSLFHLIELAAWPDTLSADGICEWLDALPLVWTYLPPNTDRIENEYWVKRAAGVADEIVAEPFAPSMLSALSFVGPSDVARVLGAAHPVVELLRLLRRVSNTRLREMAGLAQILREHDASILDERSEKEKFANIESERRRELRQRAYDTDKQLTFSRDPRYATKTCTAGDVQDLLVNLYEANPKAMAACRVRWKFADGHRAQALARKRPSTKESKQLRGSSLDLMHLTVGAAYCDVFTCDGTVSDWLGDVRETLGLKRQMAVRGKTVEEFVNSLMATWPSG